VVRGGALAGTGWRGGSDLAREVAILLNAGWKLPMLNLLYGCGGKKDIPRHETGVAYAMSDSKTKLSRLE